MRSTDDQRLILSAILLKVRSGVATSRRVLADVLRLSPTTAGQYVDHLLERAYLLECGLEKGSGGRPKRSLQVNAEAGWFAGVEFNAQRLQAVRLDFAGVYQAGHCVSLAEGIERQAVLTAIGGAIEKLGANGGGRLRGVGIGVPGVVDPQRGMGIDYQFIRDWQNVPLVQGLRDWVDVPITLDNNLRVIALAERWFGGGRGLDDFVVLGPRSGFGLAIMHGGSLFRGAHHAAGEVGRWPWPGGRFGEKIHDELSAPAVWRRLMGVSKRKRLPEDIGGALASLAAVASPARDAVVADYAQLLGCLQLLLDTRAFFLHGPLTALGNGFVEEVNAAVHMAFPELRGTKTQLIGSMLGDDAGALGAASLAMEEWVCDGAL